MSRLYIALPGGYIPNESSRPDQVIPKYYPAWVVLGFHTRRYGLFLTGDMIYPY